MIDSNGYLKCDGCGRVIGRDLAGKVEIVCPRSRCKRHNVFDTGRLPLRKLDKK